MDYSLDALCYNNIHMPLMRKRSFFERLTGAVPEEELATPPAGRKLTPQMGEV